MKIEAVWTRRIKPVKWHLVTKDQRVAATVRPEWWNSRPTGKWAASWYCLAGSPAKGWSVDGQEHIASEKEARRVAEQGFRDMHVGVELVVHEETEDQ